MKVTMNGIEREFERLSLDELYELQSEYCRETREAHERLGLYGMLDTSESRKAQQVPDSVIHVRIIELTPAGQIITLGGDED
jgi:hypothetical protein